MSLIFAGLVGLLAYHMAQRRHRHAWGWAIGSFFFVWPLILLKMLPDAAAAPESIPSFKERVITLGVIAVGLLTIVVILLANRPGGFPGNST